MDNEQKPSEETKRQWHQDPNNWIWGIFYYNKADNRILPPKRIAWMGWTVNFANPVSVSIFLILILLAFTVLISNK
jgi:uncharacterized membrane protein